MIHIELNYVGLSTGIQQVLLQIIDSRSYGCFVSFQIVFINKYLFPFLNALKVHFLDYPSHSTRPLSVQSRTCLYLTKIFLVQSHSVDLWEHNLWENVHLGINYLVTQESGIIVFYCKLRFGFIILIFTLDFFQRQIISYLQITKFYGIPKAQTIMKIIPVFLLGTLTKKTLLKVVNTL